MSETKLPRQTPMQARFLFSGRRRLTSLCGMLAVATTAPIFAAPEPEMGIKFFREKIEPVLVEHCYECHSAQAKSIKVGLRVDTRGGLLKGGESGPALVPHDNASLLLQAIRHDNDIEMPADKPKLDDEVIADFEKWVQLGAPDPRVAEAPPPDPARDPAKARVSYWAFQPLKSPAPPAVKRANWAANPIDRFVLAKLEERQLPPAPPATKAELIRRVTFDVTGLPPTPEEVKVFLADNSPTAYERVVDRLLASPHFFSNISA